MKELMLEDASSILTNPPFCSAPKIQNPCITVLDGNYFIPRCVKIVGHAFSERARENSNLRMNTSSTITKAYSYIAVSGVQYIRL